VKGKELPPFDEETLPLRKKKYFTPERLERRRGFIERKGVPI